MGFWDWLIFHYLELVEVGIGSPVGLKQDAIDLLEIDALGVVPHGFQQASPAEVFSASQQPIGGAHDQGQGLLGKRAVGQGHRIKLTLDEVCDLIRVEFGHHDRISDAGLNVVVDTQMEVGQQGGLPD